MRRVSRTGRLLGVAAVLAALLGLAAPAGAQTNTTQAPEVLFVPNVVVVNPANPDVAFIVGVYRCFGGAPIHLWVSAKQGGPDPSAEGGGSSAAAWYDTNIIDPAPVTCDGNYHAAFVPVGRHPGQGRLTSGQAWVQFCLVAPGPNGEGPDGIVASNSAFSTVVGV
jgi:hypothetical protein